MSTITASTMFTDYTDALRQEPDRWLGLVTLYSVAEVTVPHADLAALLDRNGLKKFTPRRPADVDVFRRVCSASQRKRCATSDPEVYVNILVRDVSSDDDMVLRRLVLETVDGSNRRLQYSEVYDVVFTKETKGVPSRVDVSRLGNVVSTAADEVAMEIVREYQRLVGTVDGACIRTVIGRVLDSTDTVSLRQGGGCYFVPRDAAELVAGLEQFAEHVEGTMVHSVPLPNDPKQRGNLTTAVEDEVRADIDRALTENAELLRSGEKITGPKMAALAARYRSLSSKGDRYAKLLGTDLASLKGGLHALDMQIAQLAGRPTA